MQERIPAYMQTLTVKGKSGYELAARVCSSYFDGRGIDYPAASDWDAFKEYYRQEYQREKGKALSETTLQQNFVARGKAFYRWCMEQDTPPLIETESNPQAPQHANNEEIPAPALKPAPPRETPQDTASDEAGKVRVNFLLNGNMHEALMSLAYLKGETLTAIITEAVEAYIKGYEEQIAVLRETRRKLRGE